MADSNPKKPRGSTRSPTLLLAALTVGSVLAVEQQSAAASKEAAGPVTLDAQSFELDLKNNNVFFRKPHITQGTNAITADQGQASRDALGAKMDNSVWIFRGNVKITMDQGQLTADDATVDFVKKLLAKAVANGKPAEFQQLIAKTGKVAHGHADTIDYDAGKGIVRLSKNAWLSDGQNEIHGEMLKYNVVAQTIVADVAEQGSQRVHIILTPPPSKP
jgi:lipopolysaccharide export system protein LptA